MRRPSRRRLGLAFAAVAVALLAAAAVVLASSGSSSDPQPETATAQPAASSTPACGALATSTEDITSALSHASPGEVICVADGSYPEVDLQGAFPGEAVEVRAENPGMATIE